VLCCVVVPYSFIGLQCFLVKLLSLIEVPLIEMEDSQIIEGDCDISMIGAEAQLIDLEGSSVQRDCLGVSSQELIDTSDVGQRACLCIL
jgi:hypothetical protein